MQRLKVNQDLSEKHYNKIESMIQAIAKKYAGNFGMKYEDLLQELWTTTLEKYGSNSNDWFDKNMALVNRAIQNRMKDVYKYKRRRYDSETGEVKDEHDPRKQSNLYINHNSEADNENARTYVKTRSSYMGKSNLGKIDESVVIKDMYRLILKEFGRDSYEWMFYVGMVNTEELLYYLKDELTSTEYRLYQTIHKPKDIAIDLMKCSQSGDTRYRNASRNVRDLLKRKGYTY